ncbi:cupin domain-containing protein [Sphingomonas sp. BK235]|uniref:cupin domain-containing protein n=1 Tax=Sphingomonas sp. BK235 TaxID=2512131 RepID=UPI0010480922|nr:cupin domain-containing protein [Sphingomonas sp. BK235]TCP36042.1 quercetin dioxygenase-like cupin family protein [Sphingomonas sp. BK235]
MSYVQVLAALALAGAPTAASPQTTEAPKTITLSSIKPDFSHVITNIPGKSVKTVLVTYAPGDSSPAHTHAKSAFIVAYVLEGAILSGVNGGAPRTFRAGEYWTESPGDKHGVSANASKTKPARLLAIFVVDDSDGPLTVPDHH